MTYFGWVEQAGFRVQRPGTGAGPGRGQSGHPRVQHPCSGCACSSGQKASRAKHRAFSPCLLLGETQGSSPGDHEGAEPTYALEGSARHVQKGSAARRAEDLGCCSKARGISRGGSGYHLLVCPTCALVMPRACWQAAGILPVKTSLHSSKFCRRRAGQPAL